VTRIRLRSVLATAALVAVAIPAWLYFAPTNIGGNIRYVGTSGVSMEPRFHTGDLAIVRPAANYRVGEIVAYHSTLLHTIVLHRIVAIHGNRYVFKGDNNNFLDPINPTRSDLLGTLWIHIPHGGIFLKDLHNPFVAGVIAALIAIFALFGARAQRRRRNRRRRGSGGSNHPGLPLVNRPRHHDGHHRMNCGALVAASAVAAAAFAVLAVIAFTRPAHKPSARVTPYTQQVTFGYSAHVRRSPVYPSGTIKTGDPLFLSMLRRLNLHIDYRLTTNAPASITGTEKVVLTLLGPGGWSRELVLTPQTRFVATHTGTDVTLDLPQLQATLSQIERLTNSAAFTSFSMTVGPQIQMSGSIAGHPIKGSYQPTLNLLFSSGQLQIVGAASASSAGTGSSKASQASFAPSQSGSVSDPTTAPNSLTVLGVSPQVVLLRWIAILGLLLSIAVTLYFYLRKRSEPFGETFRIQAQYGHMIVPIVGGEDLGWPPVDVPNVKALVKLAESGQRLILHNRKDNIDTYMVNEEGTVYRYQVKPSNVVWGEWSEADGPVEAAA
jgi:signal peptidase I